MQGRGCLIMSWCSQQSSQCAGLLLLPLVVPPPPHTQGPITDAQLYRNALREYLGWDQFLGAVRAVQLWRNHWGQRPAQDEVTFAGDR